MLFMPKIVDHDRYRKELLKKCFDLFASQGYGSLTMRQVAKEIGVSTGTLYHYFPSKEALFLQLIEEITQQDTSISADDIQGLETIEERILALGQFLMEHEDYFHKQTLIFINFFQQPELEQEPIIEAVKRSNQRYQEAIMQFLGIDNQGISNHVSCLIDGLIFQRAFDPESVGIEQQMELLAQMLSAYLDNQPIS